IVKLQRTHEWLQSVTTRVPPGPLACPSRRGDSARLSGSVALGVTAYVGGMTPGWVIFKFRFSGDFMGIPPTHRPWTLARIASGRTLAALVLELTE
ncbi:MAG: hypothetical protein QOD35_3539, partial [Nocardioidaceae bacterium]|nr:hypothetical protein [Nocardioidaceae bacterium]